MQQNWHRLAILGMVIVLPLLPFLVYGGADTRRELALTVGEFLDPNRWFDALKQNITIPLGKDQEISLPTPEKALGDASPKLQEVNREVREETGIDFAKFIGWTAKILGAFFNFVVELLERVSGALAG